jgi:hypothetical protein
VHGIQRLRQRAFDPRFCERSSLFWPIGRACAAVLASTGPSVDFPPVESFARAFADAGAVRFVPAAPRARRAARAQPLDPHALYDARITLEGVVPTRAGSWHDLMNALVWGTFPRAKRALHARQYRAIAERIVPGARRLPGTRTRELDALALLDEGGVVVPRSGASAAIVFGHAIYESLALGIAPAIVAALPLDVDIPLDRADAEADARAIRVVDEALARCIEDRSRLAGPHELARVELPGGVLSRATTAATSAACSIRGAAWATHGAAGAPIRGSAALPAKE